MNETIVGPARHFEEGGNFGVAATVQTPDKALVLSYAADRKLQPIGMEPFLIAMLLPAMQAHTSLRLEAPVSPDFLGATHQIQEILSAWDTRLQPISVTAESEASPEYGEGRGVGCFFSGGLDSFYTILKHREEIDCLIAVSGYTVPLGDHEVQAAVSSSLAAAAAELGLPLMEIRTSAMEATDGLCDRHIQFGQTLAGTAMALAMSFRKIFVAADHSFAHPKPGPYHPLLFPLWSTGGVEVADDGCEATRVEKAAMIAPSETALRYLRVCFFPRRALEAGSFNCGRCEKCIRTQISLFLAGVLDRCPTLPHVLDLEAISRLRVQGLDYRIFAEENLEAAVRLKSDPGLISALRTALARYPRRPDLPILEAQLSSTIRSLVQENSRMRTVLHDLRRSRSWRLTAPLRALGGRTGACADRPRPGEFMPEPGGEPPEVVGPTDLGSPQDE